jgi:hypothetical protein
MVNTYDTCCNNERNLPFPHKLQLLLFIEVSGLLLPLQRKRVTMSLNNIHQLLFIMECSVLYVQEEQHFEVLCG